MEGWASRPSRSGTSEEDDDLIILARLRDSNFSTATQDFASTRLNEGVASFPKPVTLSNIFRGRHASYLSGVRALAPARSHHSFGLLEPAHDDSLVRLLEFKSVPLVTLVLVSWGIALVE